MWTRRRPASSTSRRRHRRASSLERDAALHAGEGGAEAAVHANGRSRARHWAGGRCRSRRGGRTHRVTGGRAGHQQDRVARLDRPALELRGPPRSSAPGTATAGQQAQDLLDRGGDGAGVVDDPLPLVGVTIEQDGGVGHQLGDGLGAGAAEQPGEPAISSSSRPVCSPSPRSTVTWVRRLNMSSVGCAPSPR